MTDAARPTRVALVAHDPVWAARFEAARVTIAAAGGALLVRIEHVGSTAVPGLAAKAVLDIMPGLARLEDGPRLVPAMEALGYLHRGAYGIPGRHFFKKRIDGDPHVEQHNVHVYAVGHSEWTRHLVFRDALREDVDVRAAYEQLKRALAACFPDDVEAYAEAKSSFVDRIVTARGGPQRAR